METNQLIHELLYEEVFRTHFVHGYGSFDGIDKAIDNFIYLHELTSYQMSEDLSDDFEVSGHTKYNVNAGSDLFLELTFNYEDGDLDTIDYEIENTDLFNNLVTYTLTIILDNIKKSVIEQEFA